MLHFRRFIAFGAVFGLAFGGMTGSASAANKSAKQPRLITVCVSTESSTLRTSKSNTCAYGAEYKLVWSPRSGAPRVCVNTRNREMTLAYANTCPFKSTRLAKARINNEILACADKDTGLMRWPVTGRCWWENNPVTWFVAPTASSSFLPGSGGTAMAPGKGAVVVDGFVTDVKVAFGLDNSASINYLDDLIINVVGNSPDTAGIAVIESSSLRVSPNFPLEISGKGYAPLTLVEVWMNSTPMKIASLTSDANGDIGGVVIIPSGVEIGNHTLTFSGTLRNRKSSRASIGLEVITIQTTTGTSTAPSSKKPTTTTPKSSGSSTPDSATTTTTTTSTSTTVPDTTPPTVTLARSASTSSSAPISFTVTGNEDINCATLSLTAGTDFTLTNISTITSITQTSSDVCTIIAVSTATTNGVGVVSTLTQASTFSLDDTAGNSQTVLAGSPQSVTVTRNGEPNAPVISSTTAGDAQVTVSWSAPTSNGSSISDYVIKHSTTSGGVYTTFSDGVSTATNATVTSLVNGTAYYFKVAAVNAVGTGSYSAASADATPLGAPAFTLSSSSESKAQNVAIASYTITSTGGAIASYSISPSAPTGTSFNTSTGLLSGTPTTVQSATAYTITATNETSTASQTFTLTVTLASTTCASGGVCEVGDTGSGGGIVFYVQASGGTFTSTGSVCGTTCKYLEAAPAGWIVATQTPAQTNCATLGTSTVDPKCSWSGNSSTAVGATARGTAIGTGHGNTTAIISQSGGGSTAGHAATAARAYQGGSKTDWFLPSKLELNQLCRYAWNLTVSPTTETCTGMSGSMRGGFSTDWYWSSSEYADYPAWIQSFYLGPQGYNSKSNPYYVRPVRAFG